MRGGLSQPTSANFGAGDGFAGARYPDYDTFSAEQGKYGSRAFSVAEPRYLAARKSAAYVLTVVLLCLYCAPVTLALQLGFDPDVAFWIGRWGLLAIGVPFWVILLHVVHAFMLRRSPRPWRVVILVLSVLPGLLLVILGAVHLGIAGYLYGQLAADDCTLDAPLPDKRRLQLAYMEGFIIYIGCYQRLLAANNGSGLAYRPTLQDCEEWKEFQLTGGAFDWSTTPPPYSAEYPSVTMAPPKPMEEATWLERTRSWIRENIWKPIFSFFEAIGDWLYLNVWWPISTWVWENLWVPMAHLAGINTAGATTDATAGARSVSDRVLEDAASGRQGLEKEAKSAQTSWETAKEDLYYGLDRIGERTEVREGSHRRMKDFMKRTNEQIMDTPAWQTYSNGQADFQDRVMDGGGSAYEAGRNVLKSSGRAAGSVASQMPTSLFWSRLEHEREYKYLASMEANHVCAGFCQPGPNLFTDYDVSGKQGGKCAPIVAHKFLVVQHTSQQLFTVAVLAVTLVVVFLQCARAVMQRVGYRTGSPWEDFD